jgi:Rieske Fe-S protein
MRRRELLRSWKLWGAAMAAGGGWPTLWRWLRPETPAPDEAWVDAGALRDLPEDAWQARKLEVRRRDRWRESVRSETVYLRRSGDAVEALSAICPHSGCLVRQQGDAFACPCHGGRFDSEGALLEGPARRDLDPLPIRFERGRVQVRHQLFRTGIPERDPVAG